jgi:hypothetical protein
VGAAREITLTRLLRSSIDVRLACSIGHCLAHSHPHLIPMDHRRARWPVPAKIDIISQEYFRNPAAAIARLRTMGAVAEIRVPIVGKVWITTT